MKLRNPFSFSISVTDNISRAFFFIGGVFFFHFSEGFYRKHYANTWKLENGKV